MSNPILSKTLSPCLSSTLGQALDVQADGDRHHALAPSDKAQDCVHRLKILADTTRFEVLTLLIDGPCRVQELNAVLGLEQSLLSHHLKVLRDNGFVISEREGKAMRYRLADTLTSGIPLGGGRGLNLGCCTLALEG